MTATALSSATRYFPVGTRQYYWVASISDKTAPTRTELDAGTDLTGEIASVAGFTTTSNPVDVPDLASRFTGQVPGMITADASSLTLYLSSDSDDIRSILTRDTAGFIVQFPEGDDDGASGTLTMDVFPVKVSSASKDTTTTDPGQITISFTITSEPAENVDVPS